LTGKKHGPSHVKSILRAVATPLVEQIVLLNAQIDDMDKQIKKLSAKYPEIVLLRTVPGVEPIVAAAYVLTLGQSDAASNRSAGTFLGLRPAQSQSSAADPQRRISKSGDNFLRSLLVQIAQSTEPPYADPHVRWCGRGGELTLPPIPIPSRIPLLFVLILLN